MSTNLPTREPQVFTAGDTLTFVRQVSDYPASAGWALSYVLRGPTTIRSNAVTYSTSDYLIYESAANTSNWTAGVYSLQAYVTNSGGYRYSVDTWFPKITVKPDPSKYVEGSASNLTFAQRTLIAVESAIESLSSKKVATASVNGQSYSIQNIQALNSLRQRMREEVRSEEDAINYAAGLGVSKNILVRYPPLSSQGWVTQEGVPPIQ